MPLVSLCFITSSGVRIFLNAIHVKILISFPDCYILKSLLTLIPRLVFTPCWCGRCRRHFRGTCCLHLQGRRVKVGRNSVVGIATGYELNDIGVGVRVPVVCRIFSSQHSQDRLWGHPTSYPMGTGGSFPGAKVAGAWSWTLTSN
jgi:hypothetical protein